MGGPGGIPRSGTFPVGEFWGLAGFWGALMWHLHPAGEKAGVRVPGALCRGAAGSGPALHLHLPARTQGGAGFGVPVTGAAPPRSLGGGMVPTAPKMWEQEWFSGFGWAGRSRFVPLGCSLPPPASFGIISLPWESLGRVNSIRAGQTLCSQAFLGASRWNSFPELPRGRCGISHGGFFVVSSPGISHRGFFMVSSPGISHGGLFVVSSPGAVHLGDIRAILVSPAPSSAGTSDPPGWLLAVVAARAGRAPRVAPAARARDTGRAARQSGR